MEKKLIIFIFYERRLNLGEWIYPHLTQVANTCLTEFLDYWQYCSTGIADVFNKFKGEDGSFNKDIINEPSGLLNLYNAAHLLIHDEPALEEAKAFARHHLEFMWASLSSPLAKQVKRSLHAPLPRTCKRIETLHYISEYSEEEGHNPILLELAKLDFNLLQHVHLKELKVITEYVYSNLISLLNLLWINMDNMDFCA